jgi:hypothetical protein
MAEPGLDLHDWETRWQQLEELVADDPDQAAAEAADLLEEMLVQRGFQLDEPVTAEGEDREIVTTFLGARAVAREAERGLVEPEDVAEAMDALRAVHDYLILDRAPP